MRIFFRVINSILLVVALLAASFCAYNVYSVMRFPADEYDTKLAQTVAETEKLRADTVSAREETARRLALLGEDIRNNGEEAVAIADEIEELKAALEEKGKKLEEERTEAMILKDMPGSVSTARKLYADKIRELEDKIISGESSVKICYWTLDDGPTYITENFLNAIDDMGGHVHVTFFTANMANDSPNEEEMLRREMTSGHSVQNHTYAHNTLASGSVYRSIDSFREQVLLQDEWLFEVTGFHPGIFRFPGGAAYGGALLPEAKDVIAELGYVWADWNCNLYDAGTDLPSAAVELTRALTQVREEKIAVVLGHDWNSQTLIAMKSAIPMLQDDGYVFLPLFPESSMMGQNAKR